MSAAAAQSWIAVASAEHVRRGRAEGFMQVCHGKCTPLNRIRPGDRVAYYSPSEVFRGSDKLQAFTAIGVVKDRRPYQADMGGGFHPYRRDVQWLSANEVRIAPLLPRLAFAGGARSWGYQLRFGLFGVSEDDMDLIAQAMHARTVRAEVPDLQQPSLI